MFKEIFHLVVFSFCAVLFFVDVWHDMKELKKSSPAKEKLKFAGVLVLALLNVLLAVESLYSICNYG